MEREQIDNQTSGKRAKSEAREKERKEEKGRRKLEATAGAAAEPSPYNFESVISREVDSEESG